MKFWALTGSGPELELSIYGEIVGSAWFDDEVGAAELRAALDAAKSAERIHVRINSHGGDAFAGVAIHNMLAEHPAEVRVTVEGLAGSAASVIAMAGRVKMARGAMMMIHAPWAMTAGNANELRRTADALDKVRDGLVAIYQAKTGKTAAELEELLDAETWLGAEDALALGFADEIAGEVVAQARGEAVFFGSVRFNRSALPWAVAPLEVEEVDDMEITRERLAAEAPELLAALLAEARDEGAAAERSRMKAIDEVAMPGHEALIASARYTAPISAEALAMQIIRAERLARERFLSDAAKDGEEVDVPASPHGLEVADDAKELTKTAKAIAAGARR